MEVLLRHQNKRHRVQLEADATLQSLVNHVDKLTNVSPSRQLLKVGYPPQALQHYAYRLSEPLRDLGIHSNEVIIVEELANKESSDGGRHPVSAAVAATGEQIPEQIQEPNGDACAGSSKRILASFGDGMAAAQSQQQQQPYDEEEKGNSSKLRKSLSPSLSEREVHSADACLPAASACAVPAVSAATSKLTEKATSTHTQFPEAYTADNNRKSCCSHEDGAAEDVYGAVTGIEPFSSSRSSSRERCAAARPVPPHPDEVGEALRYVIPSDNSCLFTCLCLLAAPERTPMQLRQLVAAAIEMDPESFTDAVLEKPRREYTQWILTPTSWGGYVELAILAQQLQHEVVCVDIETGRKDFYGDPGTGRRVYLLYDGVHYDAIVARKRRKSVKNRRSTCREDGAEVMVMQHAEEDDDVFEDEFWRVFRPGDHRMEAQAAALAAALHERKQYTNLNDSAMQCLVCGEGIRDQEHARAHARELGHTNFGETHR